MGGRLRTRLDGIHPLLKYEEVQWSDQNPLVDLVMFLHGITQEKENG